MRARELSSVKEYGDQDTSPKRSNNWIYVVGATATAVAGGALVGSVLGNDTYPVVGPIRSTLTGKISFKHSTETMTLLPAPTTTTTTEKSTTTTTSMPVTVTTLPPVTTTTYTVASSSRIANVTMENSYGCGAALAYLARNQAPGFVDVCGPNVDGPNAGATCTVYDNVDRDPYCPPNENAILIGIPCNTVYMNEASNSWLRYPFIIDMQNGNTAAAQQVLNQTRYEFDPNGEACK